MEDTSNAHVPICSPAPSRAHGHGRSDADSKRTAHTTASGVCLRDCVLSAESEGNYHSSDLLILITSLFLERFSLLLCFTDPLALPPTVSKALSRKCKHFPSKHVPALPLDGGGKVEASCFVLKNFTDKKVVFTWVHDPQGSLGMAFGGLAHALTLNAIPVVRGEGPSPFLVSQKVS